MHYAHSTHYLHNWAVFRGITRINKGGEDPRNYACNEERLIRRGAALTDKTVLNGAAWAPGWPRRMGVQSGRLEGADWLPTNQ